MTLRMVVLALTVAAALAPAASAATKVETFSERASETVTFAGAGCAAEAPRSVPLPAGARNVRDLAPPVGTPLASATTPDPIAAVTRTSVEGGQAAWFATGTGPACEPGMETTPWETQGVELSVRFDVRRRVLTHRTVLARGDRICRRTARRLMPLVPRLKRAASRDVNAFVRATRVFARTLRGMNRRLGRLAIPHARARSFRAFRRAVDRFQRHMDDASDALRAGRLRAAELHVRGMESEAAAWARHARRYGFRRCGL